MSRGSLVYRDAEHDQGDARHVRDGRDLAQHDRADDGGEDRQQGQHQRERRAGQPGHGQLIGHIGDHRGAHAHPGPGQQPHRVPERGQRSVQPPRRRDDRRDDHGPREPVDVCRPAFLRGAPAAGVRHPMAEQDVEHEQRAVGEGEDEAERLTGDADRGDGDHARRGEEQGSGVAPGPRAGRGQDHGAEELDRAHRGQRQPVHRQVEHRVHDREHQAHRHQVPALADAETADQPPGPPPEGQHDGRTGDSEPRHTEHVDSREQQHGQRRPQIVENGTDQEERLWRQPVEPSGSLPSGGHERSI
jgi:hypothetical protein